MATSSVAVKTEIRELLESWDKLTTREKEQVIPVLLDRTRTWRGWSILDDNDTIIDWLEEKFADAGVAFRES